MGAQSYAPMVVVKAFPGRTSESLGYTKQWKYPTHVKSYVQLL